MCVQYSEGLPGVIIDEALEKIHVDTSGEQYLASLEGAYEHYLAQDADYFALGRDYSAGFHEFTSGDYLSAGVRYVKGQIVGPISFGFTVVDQNKRAVIYNREFCDCLIKALAMKSLWQIKKLKSAYPEAKVIIFIDEPYLSSLGSSYFNINSEEVTRMLNEVIQAIHKEGACAGVHCCGNTDWPVILNTDTDVLSFDAYNYADTLLIYRKELEDFRKRGASLAWGIVPTCADTELPSQDVLLKKIGLLKEFSLISPSCGLSGVSPLRAQDVLGLTAKIAETVT